MRRMAKLTGPGRVTANVANAASTTPSLLDALRGPDAVIAAELRPPLAELAGPEGMNAWIDTYHAVRRLSKNGTYVFLTDSAVGTAEEDNLRHLTTNLGMDVPRDRIVPFLTCKHPLGYCVAYAERAWQHGFPALVVLGGDRTLGVPRSVEHAWQLRQLIRGHDPTLVLGGWANPNADAATQVRYLLEPTFTAEFYLTQIVSHHRAGAVEQFVRECERARVDQPGMFGVFFYRSANPRTLAALAQFLPVPVAELTAEFGAGATPEQICARTIRALTNVGARHFYISNLPLSRAPAMLSRILALV
jgi:5,10-methylenetetrahydrofolate reductase